MCLVPPRARIAPDRSAQEAFAHVQELFADYDLRLTDSAGGARHAPFLDVSEADYRDAEIGPLMDRWLVGPAIGAEQRLRLMKLAWDLTGTEFGSRAGLYERLYSGDPEANGQRWFRSPVVAECEAMVTRLLGG